MLVVYVSFNRFWVWFWPNLSFYELPVFIWNVFIKLLAFCKTVTFFYKNSRSVWRFMPCIKIYQIPAFTPKKQFKKFTRIVQKLSTINIKWYKNKSMWIIELKVPIKIVLNLLVPGVH